MHFYEKALKLIFLYFKFILLKEYSMCVRYYSVITNWFLQANFDFYVTNYT
jgi:hypothetical protein